MLSCGLERANSSTEEVAAAAAAGRQAEEKCCDLAAKVEELREQLREKEEQLQDREQTVENLAKEAAVAARKEEVAAAALREAEAEGRRLLGLLEEKELLLESLDRVRSSRETELETVTIELHRLEAELTSREHEIKNLTAGRGALLCSSVHGASVLDVSVDDKLLEELSGGSSSPTPQKLLLGRGPSASSTPNDRVRRGSIVEELKEVGLNASFPSPLCGKRLQEQKLFVRLQVYTKQGPNDFTIVIDMVYNLVLIVFNSSIYWTVG